MSRKKNFLESHIINPLLTKLVRSRWQDIYLILFVFFEFADLDSTPPKKLGQYPVILTSRLVNNPYNVYHTMITTWIGMLIKKNLCTLLLSPHTPLEPSTTAKTPLRRFPHNIRAIMAKIKLPKNSLSMVIFWMMKVRRSY